MRNYKKYLAAALAATMVVGSSTVAFASTPGYVSSSDTALSGSNSAGGTINAGGSMVGTVDKKVFHVVVPTCITTGNTTDAFDFVLDPAKLITATQAAKYVTGANAVADDFEPDKTLYFVNKTSRKIDDTSDFIKVTNKSSMDVEMQLNASISGLTDIELSNTKTFADKKTSMYLAVTDGTKENAIVSAGTTVKKTIGAAPAGAYETQYDEATGSYVYNLVDDAATFDTYEFGLTGATNSAADWGSVNESPALTITWTINPAPEPAAPSIATTSYTMSAGNPVEVTVDLGTGNKAATGIASITYTTASSNNPSTLAADRYSFSNGKLTIAQSYVDTLLGLSNFTSRDFNITFNDTARTVVTITLNK